MWSWYNQICTWRNWYVQGWWVNFYFKSRNYGPTLGITKEANMRKHQQVLWLYDDKKIIEVGASNIFFIFKSTTGKKAEIVTPHLEDLILPGITRDSIIVFFHLTKVILTSTSWIWYCWEINHDWRGYWEEQEGRVARMFQFWNCCGYWFCEEYWVQRGKSCYLNWPYSPCWPNYVRYQKRYLGYSRRHCQRHFWMDESRQLRKFDLSNKYLIY